MIIWSILCFILSYLLGSIPFALVIGKVFYHTDVRKYGSGNLGGTNAGRVLGKKAGIAVIVCDALKVVLAVGISSLVSQNVAIWSGLFCCIGHCYPVFAHFKGGKAVASMFGYLLAISIFVFKDAWYFIVPLLMFFAILFIFKYVSLGSLCASIASTIYILANNLQFNFSSISIIIASILMTALVIYRHAPNIEKIENGTENKVSWLK